MWGYKNSMNRETALMIFNKIKDHASSYYAAKYTDQFFLRDKVWPIAKQNATIHDSFHCKQYGGESFPKQRMEKYCFAACDGVCCEDSTHKWPYVCPIECRPKDHKDWIYC